MQREQHQAPARDDDDDLPPWLGERFADFADKYCNSISPVRRVAVADNREADGA